MTKKIILFFICFTVVLFMRSQTNGNGMQKGVIPPPQVMSTCNNLDFETGNTSGWTVTSGNINSVNLPCDTCPSHPGGIATVVNTSSTYGPCKAGIDSLGGFSVVAPNGGNYSLLLNDISTGGKIESIKQTFLVTSSNAYFTYRFAAVLQDGSHPATDQPYFNAEVLDQTGSVISCAKYEVSASSSIPGWLTSTKDATVHYKPWTAVFVDLSPYIGTNVTLKFVVSDCNQSAHYGYAYIDASCSSSNPFIIGYPSGCGNYPITITAPEGGFSYLWSGTGITGSNTVQTVTVSTGGNYSVMLKNLTDTSCHFSISTSVQAISAQPTASFTNGTACVGATNFTNLSTNNPQNLIWRFGDGTFSTFQNPTHIYTTAGNYTVTLIAINSCGKDSMKRVITVNPKPNVTVSATSHTVCSGSSVTLTAGGANSYSWSPAQGLSSTTTPTVAASPTIATVYNVMGTSSVGCSASNTVSLLVSKPTITATLTTTNPVCSGSCNGSASVTITSGIGNYTYVWNTSATTTSISNLCAGNYSVNIKNNTCGTQLAKTLTITTPSQVVENVSHTNVTCYPSNGTININTSGGTGPYTYAINTGAYAISNSFTGLNAGTYTVFSKDINSCLAYSLVTITQSAINNPTVTVNSDTICSGDSIILTAQGATTYTWVPSSYLSNSASASVVAFPPNSITYTIVGTDNNNCKNFAVSTLLVMSSNSSFCATGGVVKIHNAFSPNNDGLNDLFIIDNINETADNHVYIYNRWGQLLWDKSKYDNITIVWDGKTQDGIALYAGTYFYVIEIKGQTTLKGWVELTK
jgi:gliding motility-associated-like protein